MEKERRVQREGVRMVVRRGNAVLKKAEPKVGDHAGSADPARAVNAREKDVVNGVHVRGAERADGDASVIATMIGEVVGLENVKSANHVSPL